MAVTAVIALFLSTHVLFVHLLTPLVKSNERNQRNTGESNSAIRSIAPSSGYKDAGSAKIGPHSIGVVRLFMPSKTIGRTYGSRWHVEPLQTIRANAMIGSLAVRSAKI